MCSTAWQPSAARAHRVRVGDVAAHELDAVGQPGAGCCPRAPAGAARARAACEGAGHVLAQEAGAPGEEDLHARAGGAAGAAACAWRRQCASRSARVWRSGMLRRPARGVAQLLRVADDGGDVGGPHAARDRGGPRSRTPETSSSSCSTSPMAMPAPAADVVGLARPPLLEQQPVGAHDVAHVGEVAHGVEVARPRARRAGARPRSPRSGARRSSPRRPRRGRGRCGGRCACSTTGTPWDRKYCRAR